MYEVVDQAVGGGDLGLEGGFLTGSSGCRQMVM